MKSLRLMLYVVLMSVLPLSISNLASTQTE